MLDSLYKIGESYARYSLTDAIYEKIREYLPIDQSTGRPGMDIRLFLDALILLPVRDAAGEVSPRNMESGILSTRNSDYGNLKMCSGRYICA